MTDTASFPATEPVGAGETIACFDPATGDRLGDVAVDSPAEVQTCIRRAREAQRAWGRSTFAERRAVLRHLLAHVMRHADELCELIVRDSGKTREHALMGEVWPVAEKLRWTIAHGEAHLRPEPRSPGLFVHKRAKVEFPPRGVVGVICPWNYPLQNVMGPTIAALMAGNAVVVKVSEWVAWSSQRIQAIFDEAFAKAGYPAETVQLVNGYGETGRALVQGGIDLTIFTGSVDNGRRVLEAAAPSITPVILELGGKDALIVCDDAHLEQAAHAAMAGVFIAAGQNCLAAERVLVFDAMYEPFVHRVAALTKGLRQRAPGDAPGEVDVGAMTSRTQLDIVERRVDDAVAKGARVLAGGRRASHGSGWYFEPTVLADVTSDMDIAHEETFGPVMCLMRVADESEAVRVANETSFGLGVTIMSKSQERARRMQQRVVTGTASINDFGLTYMAQDLPFGGAKASGFGRINGREGLRACTRPQAVLSDRFPLHVPAKLYPVGPSDYAHMREGFRLLYGPGIFDRLRAAGVLARTLLGR